MSDRLKMPPEHDFGFYQRRKHDKWREVPAPAPALEAPVADSHAHIHMLPDPAWELARCAVNGVDFVCMIADPSEDGSRPFDELDAWLEGARATIRGARAERVPAGTASVARGADAGDAAVAVNAAVAADPANAAAAASPAVVPDAAIAAGATDGASTASVDVRIAVGVHPHNAKMYHDTMEDELVKRLRDPRVVALGEIGLDFHYDLSPRDVQRDVFRRQIRLAKELDLPIALHLRGGADAQEDNAHREAFAILREEDALGPGTLLHCCALPPDELRPWLEADCHIAYGGAITFKNADAAREGARLVPDNRLLLETDAPYMTPEPMRGAACTPAHVIFTAAALAELRGFAPGPARKRFLAQLHANTLAFYR